MSASIAPAPVRRRGTKKRIRWRVLLLILLLVIAVFAVRSHFGRRQVTLTTLEQDWVTVDLLPVNQYSRPGIPLKEVNGIVVHYTGNPNTTAEQTKSYFYQSGDHRRNLRQQPLYHRHGRHNFAVRPAERGVLLLQLQKRGHRRHRMLPPGPLRAIYR